MTRRHALLTIIGLLGSVPVWAAGRGLAMGARAERQVAIVCTGAGETALHNALCEKLMAELTKTHPDYVFVGDGAPTSLTITVTLERATKTTLIGRLSWQGSATGQGPDVTSGTRDATIGRREIGMFASALLKVTPLPL